jgi:hypothetical protein
MTLIIEENQNTNRVPRVPEGRHKARCVKIIDLGSQKQTFGEGGWKKKYMFIFEFPEILKDNNEPETLSNWYTQSLYEKSNLAKDLTSWRGRALTQTEKNRFDVTSLLGDPCEVDVISKNDKPKINYIAKIKDQEPMPEQIIPSFFFSIAEYQKGNKEKFNQLSEGIRNIILKSKELEGLDKTNSTDYGTSDMNHDTVPF